MVVRVTTHAYNLASTFRNNGHFTQEWTSCRDGKEAQNVVIEFERVMCQRDSFQLPQKNFVKKISNFSFFVLV